MNILIRKIKRAAEIWSARGWFGIKEHSKEIYRKNREKKSYPRWIKKFDGSGNRDRRKIRRRIGKLKHQPLISVVMPVYNVEEKWLRLCIESVLNQIYENWEFCIADDCSPAPHIRRVLEEYAAADHRIKITFREKNGHISAASNSALELATGEFVVLLDHDDELAPHALYYVATELNDFPETQMIYSDEDMIDESGNRYAPKFKPDWSRDLLYSMNLITHLSGYRTTVLRQIKGFRVGLEGSQDYDLALRVIEQIPDQTIRHIPRILYHWRAIRGSVALDSDEKPYAHERAREAIRDHLARTGKAARVSQTVYNLHRVQYELPQPVPKVSLLMLIDEYSATTFQHLKNFIEKTDYPNFEIVLVGTPPLKEKIRAQKLPENVKIIDGENANRAERYNAAARQTNSEMLVFVDENLRPASKDWLDELIGFATQREIGAVGAKILNADETIRHSGVILGVANLVGDAHRGLLREFPGNLGRAQLAGNFSAVSIECLAVRREIFQAADGFDTVNFPETLFDVDFCLRLREKNLRIVWTPYAELINLESRKSSAAEIKLSVAERDFFKRKWRGQIERDPFYNPNFSRRKKFSILDK